jgi:hypothetical protein
VGFSDAARRPVAVLSSSKAGRSLRRQEHPARRRLGLPGARFFVRLAARTFSLSRAATATLSFRPPGGMFRSVPLCAKLIIALDEPATYGELPFNSPARRATPTSPLFAKLEISFASRAIASLIVRSFLPSGNSIGSLNVRDHDI